MLLSETMLLTLSFLGIVLSPIYLYLRSQMTKFKKPHEYSKKTIFRVLAMHFFMIFTITLIHVVILQSMLTGGQFISQKAIFTISSQLLFLAAALYGSGIYITAILFERFVTRKYLVIRFLHGPMSHIAIYFSYLGAFGNLSLISTALQVNSTMEYNAVFLVLGITSGVVAAIDNLANGILLPSLLGSLVALVIYLALNTEVNTFYIYFIGLLSGSLFVGTILVIVRFVKFKRLSWYEPTSIFGK